MPCLSRLRLSVSPVGNLETAGLFSLDHNFAVKRAQFDLSNVTANGVGLFGDQSRVLRDTHGLCNAKGICIGELLFQKGRYVSRRLYGLGRRCPASEIRIRLNTIGRFCTFFLPILLKNGTSTHIPQWGTKYASIQTLARSFCKNQTCEQSRGFESISKNEYQETNRHNFSVGHCETFCDNLGCCLNSGLSV